MRRLALFLLLLVGFVRPALAQGAADDRREFEAFLASPPYLSGLTQLMNESEPPSMKASCPALKLIEAKRYLVLKNVTFREEKGVRHVSAGSWISLVIADRCGQKVTRRFLFIFRPEMGRLQPVRLLPGDFRADLKTEAITRQMAATKIMAVTGCEQSEKVFVLDVKRDGAATGAHWEENWATEGCGKPLTLHVAYTRSADGKMKVDMTVPTDGAPKEK